MLKRSNKTNIADWIKQAQTKLAKISNSAKLDAELILADATGRKRIYLHTNPEHILKPKELAKANKMLKKRAKNYPIAYLTHNKEFYGLDFYVNSKVLIPRAESEDIITIALDNLPKAKPIKILDLGCGSGALGISLAYQLKNNYQLTLADISPKALTIARQNAQKYQITADLIKTDLLTKINNHYDIILANLPYVNKDWEFIKNIEYEPKKAIFANDNGLELIKKFIQQLCKLPKNNKTLVIIESDPSQQPALADFIQKQLKVTPKHQSYQTYFFIN